MPPRTLALFAVIASPLVAQAGWTEAPIAPAEPFHRPSVAVGDVDGDRIDDLVLGRNGVIVVRRGTRPAPERQFEARERAVPSRAADTEPAPVAVGPSCECAGQPRLADVDRDGDLDIVAPGGEPHGFGGAHSIFWFPNDGRGTFAAARDLPVAGRMRFAVRGELRTVDFADVDRDGHLDLLISSGELTLHRGSAAGFAAAGRDLGAPVRGSAVLADWDGDGTPDLLYVDNGAVELRRGTSDDYAQPERLAEVAGSSEVVQLATADWNGDGRVDLLLGESLPQQRPPAPVDPAKDAEAKARRDAAQRVLHVVNQEIARLNATKPPRDDAAAMADRAAWRDQLGIWSEGARAVVEQPGASRRNVSPGGRLRALLRP